MAMTFMNFALRSVFAAAFIAFTASAQAAVNLPGTPLTSVDAPAFLPTLGADEFYLPIEVQGASDVQEFGFFLTFDPTVVLGVDDPVMMTSIFGAYFDPADTSTPVSFILSGFLFNAFGLVDSVAGSYPAPPFSVTGDGVLAYLRFVEITGATGSPNFAIDGATLNGLPAAQMPLPSTSVLALLGALVLSGSLAVRAPSMRPKQVLGA
jgi:hypothetical protein